MKTNPPRLEQILDAHTRALASTLRPSTLRNYRCATRRFLSYLHTSFPGIERIDQLSRDPHLFGWFASLWQPHSPNHAALSNSTRRNHLVCIRRLFDDLAANGHSVSADLIRRDDFPPLPHYLPRPLSHTDDELLLRQLRRHDDLPHLALRVMRATGIRVGECIDLSVDCLRQVGPDQWALHVPIGKLHSERLVPADGELRAVIARMRTLRTSERKDSSHSAGAWLLPRTSADHDRWYHILRTTLQQAAQSAGCSAPPQPHQLRHTFATEMLRLGVSLPALKLMLGHNDIRMTLRYVEITQEDLQREFYGARENASLRHRIPDRQVAQAPDAGSLAAVRQTLSSARHILEMFRRGRTDTNQRNKLHRLDRRLQAVLTQLNRLEKPEK